MESVKFACMIISSVSSIPGMKSAGADSETRTVCDDLLGDDSRDPIICLAWCVDCLWVVAQNSPCSPSTSALCNMLT